MFQQVHIPVLVQSQPIVIYYHQAGISIKRFQMEVIGLQQLVV
jgi:hypothetical protein